MNIDKYLYSSHSKEVVCLAFSFPLIFFLFLSCYPPPPPPPPFLFFFSPSPQIPCSFLSSLMRGGWRFRNV
ncbi:unnamed protein product [Penicillium salamii]|nr:unnamed protein product [Penicillium salamii]